MGLLASGVQVSMDGRGRCLDKVYIERLWRSVKKELTRHEDYRTREEARASLFEYIR